MSDKRNLILALIALILIALILLSGDIRGQTVINKPEVTLVWDPNSEVDLAGYKVYRGTQSRVYGPAIATVGVSAAPTFTVQSLVNGLYYFAVTAFNTLGLESGFSNEVSAEVRIPPADPKTLRISAPPLAFLIDKKTMQVVWVTNEPSTSEISYNRIGFPPVQISDARHVTNHILILRNLQPNQLWEYTIRSAAGDEAVEASGSFVSAR